MLTREDGMIDAGKESDEQTEHPRRALGSSRGGGEVHTPGVAARSESQGGEQPGAAGIGGRDSRRDPDVEAERLLLREFEERRSRKRAEIAPRRAATLNPTPSEVHFTQDSQDSQTLLDHQDSQGTHRALREETAESAHSPDLSLPLHLFIQAAADSESLWFEDQLAEAEYASQVEWKKGWHFIRLLRGHPELRDLDGRSALRKVKLLLGDLERQGWSYYEVTSYEESDFDATFLRCWAAIRCPLGEEPLDTAVRLAKRHPLRSCPVEEGELSYYDKVLSIAGWLQFGVGDRPIALPTRMLGDLVGCSPRSVSTFLKMAQADGFLDLVKKYPLKRRMAYEYRFHTERWPILKNGPPREETP
jgi:hypothetical protein